MTAAVVSYWLLNTSFAYTCQIFLILWFQMEFQFQIENAKHSLDRVVAIYFLFAQPSFPRHN